MAQSTIIDPHIGREMEPERRVIFGLEGMSFDQGLIIIKSRKELERAGFQTHWSPHTKLDLESAKKRIESYDQFEDAVDPLQRPRAPWPKWLGVKGKSLRTEFEGFGINERLMTATCYGIMLNPYALSASVRGRGFYTPREIEMIQKEAKAVKDITGLEIRVCVYRP